jgi:hypothetical protein
MYLLEQKRDFRIVFPVDICFLKKLDTLGLRFIIICQLDMIVDPAFFFYL